MSQNVPNSRLDTILTDKKSMLLDPSQSIKRSSPSTLIEWSLPLGSYLYNELCKLSPPFRVHDLPFDEPLYSVIKGFLYSLDGYIESSNPLIPYNNIISGTCLEGPAYTKKLKLIRRKSIYKTWTATLIEEDPALEGIPAYHFNDIGDIFNYEYLPNWSTEDPEDYKYGMVPCEINPEYLNKFRESAINVLNSVTSYEKIDPEEILTGLSGSKSFNENETRNPYHFQNIKSKPKFSKRIRLMKRTLINVKPGSVRDSVLLEPNDLNTVKFIDKQLREILRNVPNHIHVSDPYEIQSRYNDFRDNNLFFFMRDIKKEGITKPKALIKIMLEELQKFTGIEYFYPDLFSDYELDLSTERIRPIRGHGLGMGNALTTFMQLIIWDICLNEESSEGINFSGECLALNDDFVAGFESSEELETYYDIERTVMLNLGIITEYNKTFFCYHSFVIAEMYSIPNNNKKESYWRAAMLRTLSCVNITHAKSLINSCVSAESQIYYDEYIEEIIQNFGFEFFPEEYRYPSAFGGWTSSKLMGVCLDLKELKQLPYNNDVVKAYNACKHNKIKTIRRTPKFDYTSPWTHLHPNLNFGKRGELFDVTDSKTVARKYFRLNEQDFYPAWHNLYIERKKAFKGNPIPFREFIRTIVIDNPTKTYYPLKFMRNDIIVNHIDGNLKDLYTSRNPRMAYLKTLNPELQTDEIAEQYSINFTEFDASTSGISNHTREMLKRSIIPNIKNCIVSDFYGIPKPMNDQDDLEIHRSYISPICIYNIRNLFNKRGLFPILKEEFRSPLVYEKEAIFTRFLTFEEEIFVQDILSRRKIRELVIASKECLVTIQEYLRIVDEVFELKLEEPEKIEEDNFPDEIDGKATWRCYSLTEYFSKFYEMRGCMDDYIFIQPYQGYFNLWFTAISLYERSSDRYDSNILSPEEKKRQDQNFKKHLLSHWDISHPEMKMLYAKTIRDLDSYQMSSEPIYEPEAADYEDDGDYGLFGEEDE